MKKTPYFNYSFILLTLSLSACQFSSSPSNHNISHSSTTIKTKNTFDLQHDFANIDPNASLKNMLPNNQWNLIYDSSESANGIVINFNSHGSQLRMALNCTDHNKLPYFLLEDADGVDVITSKSSEFADIQIILDGQIFHNPFNHHHSDYFQKFKTAFYSAQHLKIQAFVEQQTAADMKPTMVLSQEFQFNNQYAELLKQASSSCTIQE